MKKYKNIVSLGYFCSPALEIERYGYRNFSLPFDWLISDFESILNLIDNRFTDFLSYELMEQNATSRSKYRNSKYNIYFFHDFNEYVALDLQLAEVREKYQRRIERFYSIIKDETLFVRYVKDKQEISFINENCHNIENLFKIYNSDSHVVYIANRDLEDYFGGEAVRKLAVGSVNSSK